MCILLFITTEQVLTLGSYLPAKALPKSSLCFNNADDTVQCKRKYFVACWRDSSSRIKAFALPTAHPNLIPVSAYSPNTARMIPEHRTRSMPQAQLDVAHKPKEIFVWEKKLNSLNGEFQKTLETELQICSWSLRAKKLGRSGLSLFMSF